MLCYFLRKTFRTTVVLIPLMAISSSRVVAEPRVESSSCQAEGTNRSLQAMLDQKEQPPLILPPSNLWLPRSVLDTDDFKSPNRWKPVMACCRPRRTTTANAKDSSSASRQTQSVQDDSSYVTLEPIEIGKMPQFSTPTALQVLDETVTKGWQGGMGPWTQLSLQERVACLEKFLAELDKVKDELVQALMWEIGKNRKDATSEVDRTIEFARAVIQVVQTDDEFSGTAFQTIGSTRALIRRAAIGVILCLGPYNYPLNETYAALIPALLMGNVCILKIPTVGGLVHLLTMKAFQKALPAGTIHFIAGSGRSTMPPLMKTGMIDGLAFIGGSDAADDLIQSHPHPHRLKVFLQLEANNMAIYLPDLFEGMDDDSDAAKASLLETAMDQAVVGSLSYNGQRCTALKLHLVPKAHAQTFVSELVERVEALTVGLPWQTHDTAGGITPLPNEKRIRYMQDLLEDALSKGAKIQNKNGGTLVGGENSTLMVPAVLYPVTPEMRVHSEEQFGPLVPVATYDSLDKDVLPLAQNGPYGQQVSIFGTDPGWISTLVDRLSAIYCRINLNTSCGRSPDSLPFAGRRSSAMGVMSIRDALKEFSLPTVVSYKDDDPSGSLSALQNELAASVQDKAQFLHPVA